MNICLTHTNFFKGCEEIEFGITEETFTFCSPWVSHQDYPRFLSRYFSSKETRCRIFLSGILSRKRYQALFHLYVIVVWNKMRGI